MTLLNEGEADRAIRILGGILVSGVGADLTNEAVGVVLMVVGAIALFTGLAGWCPAYTAFGISTKSSSADGCPHRDTRNRW